MNGFYDIILILIIFGAAGSLFNDMVAPVFGVNAPSGGFEVTEDKFTEYQSSTNPTTVDDFTWTNIILMGLRMLGSAALAVVTIIPLVISICMTCGLDFETSAMLAVVIQGPVWWVCITGWYEWSTGRSLT
jgi:hypothetical protein